MTKLMRKFALPDVSHLLILSITCLAVGIPVAHGQDAPPSSDTVPTKLATGLYYTIRKGDTMWALSQRFYDSPWVWPELWNRNKAFPSPHWMYPGERIRIYTREELQQMLGQEEQLSEGNGDVGAESKAFSDMQERYFNYPEIDRVGFLRSAAMPATGTILKVKANRAMACALDRVYLRAADGQSFTPGDKFTVFRVMDPLKDPDTRRVVGIPHLIVGILEIKEVQPEYAEGQIVRFFEKIVAGDQIMSYQKRSSHIKLIDGPASLTGKVLGAENCKLIMGQGQLVFLSKGDRDGVKIGQTYNAYVQSEHKIIEQNKDQRQSQSGALSWWPEKKQSRAFSLSPVDYAKAIVLHVEDTSATALLLKSEWAVTPGTLIRASSSSCP